MVEFFGGIFSGTGFGDDAVAHLSGMFGGGGTITVSADEPFSATVAGRALSDEEHPDRHLDIATAIHCDQ
jgi:hypothetical protein